MVSKLRTRRREAELMDDPGLPESAHVSALRGLARINFVSRTVASLWPTIAAMAKAKRPGSRLSVLDLACGGGEVIIGLTRRADRHCFALDATGCDVSEVALRNAASRADAKGVAVKFRRFDALTGPLPRHYDIITTSLFLHHLGNEDIVALLKRLSANAECLLMTDLLRGRRGYALAWLGTHCLSTSRIVHVDGMRSLRAALTLFEARQLATEAGLDKAEFRTVWPRRFLMTWNRSKDGDRHAA